MSADRDLDVLLDGYWWKSGAASGRNVVTSLVTTWGARYPGDRLTLAVRPHERPAIEADLQRLGVTASLVNYPRLARVQALAARSLGRRAARYDAVLTQNFATRCRNAISCVLVHDAMYVEHPEWFSFPERVYLSALRPMLGGAAIIFTTSQSETDRIARVWPETRSRLRAIGLGVPISLTEAVSRRPDSLHGDMPFILVVGRLNIRKNLRRLLDAFLQSPTLPTSYRLVVVGEPDGKLDPAAMSSGAANVSFLDNIDDGGLRWLYEHCALFVFPSLDEGFGLPLIEAHSLGARALASDIPPFRELGGAEAYFDPRSVDEIGLAMSTALAGPPIALAAQPAGWDTVVSSIRDEIVTLAVRNRDVTAR
ncbi:MAG: glycosyltransferase family 1 protein [Pseudolysinimonas sp.]